MNKQGYEFVKVMGFGLSFGLSVVMYMTFIKAYLNGGDVVVSINDYGEAGFELILVTFIIIFSCVALILVFKDIKNTRDKSNI